MTTSESASPRAASQVTGLRASARAERPAITTAGTSRRAGERERSDIVRGQHCTSPFDRHCLFTDGWGA